MKSLINEVKNIYDAIGLDYSLTRPHLTQKVISLFPPLPPKARVLDLGCGNGVLLTALPKDIDYTGIDFSKILIKEAKKLYPHKKFILADITEESTYQNLPQFDAIFCLSVLHHLTTTRDHLFVLEQIKKHLKTGGTAPISVWRLWKLKFIRYHISLRHLMIPFHGGPKRFFYAFTQKGLENLCQKAGFQITKVTQTKNNLFLHLRVSS